MPIDFKRLAELRALSPQQQENLELEDYLLLNLSNRMESILPEMFLPPDQQPPTATPSSPG